MSQEKNNRTNGGQRYILTRETIGMTVLLLSAIILVMLLSNDAVFSSVGAGVCTFMYGTFGYGCFLVLALLCYLGVYLVWNKRLSVPVKWIAPICLASVCVFFLFHSVTAYAFGISLDEGYGTFISDCYLSASAGFSGYTFGGVISSLIVYPVARLTTYVGAISVFAVLSVIFAGLIFYVVRRSAHGAVSSIRFVNGSMRHSYGAEPDSMQGNVRMRSSQNSANYGLGEVPYDGVRSSGSEPSFDSGYNPYDGTGYYDQSQIAQQFYSGHDEEQYATGTSFGYGRSDDGSGASQGYDSSNWKEREISSADAYDPGKYTRDGLGKKLLFEPISDSDAYYKNMLYDDTSYFHGSNGNGGYQGGNVNHVGRDDMYRGSDDDYLKSLGLFNDDKGSSSSYSDYSAPDMSGSSFGDEPDDSGYSPFGGYSSGSSSSSSFVRNERDYSESFRSADESDGFTPQGYVYGESPTDNMGPEQDDEYVRPRENYSDFGLGADVGSVDDSYGLDGNQDPVGEDVIPGLPGRSRRGRGVDSSFDESGDVGDEPKTIISEADVSGVGSRGRAGTGPSRRFEDLFKGEEELSSFDTNGDNSVGGNGLADNSIGSRRDADDSVSSGRVGPRSLIDRIEEESEVKEEKKPHVWKHYKAPGVDLLKDYSELGETDEIEIERNKKAIVDALEDYRIESEVINVIVGCKITRYDVKILNNTQIINAEKHARDIQLALKKETINVYINYKISALSVEVPNRKSGTIGLKALLESGQFRKAEHGGLAFGLGKNMEGECICPDITDMPHLLIAGTTGSGKSVCLNSMIVSLIYKYSPEELRLILIDPKQVEFVPYNNLPHLMIDEIPSSVDKVIKILNWTIGEMERRYALFRDMTIKNGKTTRDLKEYNENVSKKEDRLCKIVLVMDEFGDLMMQARKDIEALIIRLVQKSRACGIHLILATQRPSVDCITGLIKSNLPARIGFKVNSFKDSQTIFDRGGAEKLLGSGDMLFRRPDRDELVRIQGCYISASEVQAITDYVKENNETFFDEDLKEYINTMDTPETGGQRGADDPDAKFDETYVKVLGFCVMHNTASISMIQRNFPIGYMKACKIVDWMENMNYISPNEGSKARKVLLSRDEFIATYGEDELNG